MATNVIGMMNASFDTTRATQSWILLWVAEKAALQTKLYDEIVERFGETPGPITMQHTKGFPLLDAVILESMRYVATVPINQRISEDHVLEIGNYVIPKDITINLPYSLAGRYPTHFNDKAFSVSDFCPERFMRGSTAARGCRHAPEPFGAGPRCCAGKTFAMVELRIILIYRVHLFTITLPGEGEPVAPIGTSRSQPAWRSATAGIQEAIDCRASPSPEPAK